MESNISHSLPASLKVAWGLVGLSYIEMWLVNVKVLAMRLVRL